MKLTLVACAALASATAIPQAGSGPCTADRRLQIAMDIIGAFNDPNPVRSAATIQAAPFKPDGTIDLLVALPASQTLDTNRSSRCINGAPCVRAGYDAQTSKLVAIAARQAVSSVETKFSTFDNGTTIMDAVVTFGVGALGVPVPVKTAIFVVGDIDTSDCQIRALPAFFTLPNEVAGMPVRPPFLPDLGLPPVALPIPRLPRPF